MLDTINLKLTRADVEGVSFFDEVTPLLDSFTTTIDEGGCIKRVRGRLGNLNVVINPFQVEVRDGSICKWQLGDNYQTMSREDVKQAMERLSDALHLPMHKAMVTRLDVGASIVVNETPLNYLNHLGELSRAKRLLCPSCLYYYRHSRGEVLCFYDKNKEQREHRVAIPDPYKGCNVLRYELRYEKKLPKLLNVPSVTGSMLYDADFYNSLVNRWCDVYLSINKTRDLTLNLKEMRGVRNFNRMARKAFIMYMGGEVEVLTQIEEAQRSGVLSADEAYLIRAEVRKIAKDDEPIMIQNCCIDELTDKIKQIAERYTNT